MSKVVDQPITVQHNTAGYLTGFTWRNHIHQVTTLLEEWRDTGCWWNGEAAKDFYRLCTADGEYELYRELGTNSWRLYRIID